MKRIVKRIRWFTLIFAVLSAAMLSASAWNSLVWKSQPTSSGFAIGLGVEAGLIVVASGTDRVPAPPGGIGPGWTLNPYGPRPSPGVHWTPVYLPSPRGTSVGIPIWPFALIAGALCAWGFLLARVTPPGCCKSCGYDLAGVTAKLCPECGSDEGPVPTKNG